MKELVEHYGLEVPGKLFTPQVKAYINMVENSLNKFEQELDSTVGKKKTSLRDYIDKVKENIKFAPYRLNGDFSLVKFKTMGEEKSKPTSKRKSTKREVVNKKTRNQSKIFGK